MILWTNADDAMKSLKSMSVIKLSMGLDKLKLDKNNNASVIKQLLLVHGYCAPVTFWVHLGSC